MTAPDPVRKTTPECVTEGDGGPRVDFDRLRATSQRCQDAARNGSQKVSLTCGVWRR